MKQYKKYPFIINDITVIVSLIVLIIMFIITNSSAQTITTNPWYDTRWGGDTGEQNYTEPINPVPENEFCNLCGGIIVIAYIIPSYAIMTRKEKKQDDK